MSFKIGVKSDSDKLYFEGKSPVHGKKKMEGTDFVELKWQSRIEFVFYIEEVQNLKKPANYNFFHIDDPGDHVEIEIKKDNNSNELITVIEWPKNVQQKSKDVLPPDNVNVGVKE